MTTLEIILIAIIWISYGLFSAKQISDKNCSHNEELIFNYLLCIVFAPIVLIARIFIGMFSDRSI